MSNANVQEQVQKVLDAAVAEENGVPGLVFGMMDRKGNYLAKAAAGVRGLNRKDEMMTTDTAFAIYSCTKVRIVSSCPGGSIRQWDEAY
jgi:methyl acetate hydrolase